jgi:tol-pal system protein YbgF
VRTFISGLLVIGLLSIGGCASTDDLRRVHGALDRQIQLTNDKIAAVEQGQAEAANAQKGEIAAVRKEIDREGEKTSGVIAGLRGNQAEARADITEIREQLQQIRGSIDSLRKDLATSTTKTGRRDDEEKVIREKVDALTFRMNFVESFLGIGKEREAADAIGDKSSRQPAPKEAAGKAKVEVKGEVKTDKESLYNAAYDLFREAKYEKSREAFEHFLKLYPRTEFSDNAQFWIGECYYFEKKYEKAIVEYDKIIKNFSEGDKVPYALLKQGLSFLNLGDKASARLLLQQVIKDFPNTSQARIARQRLAEIK